MSKAKKQNALMAFVSKYAVYIIIAIVLLIALVILMTPPVETAKTVGGPEEVADVSPTPDPEPQSTVTVNTWQGESGNLENVVQLPDTDIKACTIHGYGTSLNKSADKNITACALACKSLKHTVAALKPLKYKTLPVCQCFKPSGNTFPVASGSRKSFFAYDAKQLSFSQSQSCTGDACYAQAANTIEFSAKSCPTAQQNVSNSDKGYHSYHVKNSLLEYPINIWYDSKDKQVKFERQNETKDKVLH